MEFIDIPTPEEVKRLSIDIGSEDFAKSLNRNRNSIIKAIRAREAACTVVIHPGEHDYMQKLLGKMFAEKGWRIKIIQNSLSQDGRFRCEVVPKPGFWQEISESEMAFPFAVAAFVVIFVVFILITGVLVSL
jgi:hypothetical protein